MKEKVIMLEFKKIEIDDVNIYNKYIGNNAELSCENAFVNLLVWQCKYNNMMAVKDGQIFIKSGFGTRESFRLPLGGDLKTGIALLEEYCGDKKPVFWSPECTDFEKFKADFGKKYNFTEVRDAFEYVYLRENLAELSGKKFHSKRNHINSFSKKHNWHYETITSENVEAVKLCAEHWYTEKADKTDEDMLCEKRGLDNILDNMEVLGVKGGAIYVDDKVVAFTIGSPISEETFDIHIEKALSEYAEGYTVINREFAKNELSSYKYINREDDMGLEGLRKAKLSYNPDILLKKYVIR